jgi:hypothetical protein
MKKTVLFVSLIVASQCQAGQFWADAWDEFWPEDETTQALIVADSALMLADWAQTREIADHPEQFSEQGLLKSLIGEHPTSGEVNKGYAAVFLGTHLIGYLLPEQITTFGFTWNPSKAFYVVNTAGDAYTVYDNYEAGVSIRF